MSNQRLEQELAKKKDAQNDQYSGLSDKERDSLTIIDGQINIKRQQLAEEQVLTVRVESQAVDLKQNELLQEMLQLKIKCD